MGREEIGLFFEIKDWDDTYRMEGKNEVDMEEDLRCILRRIHPWVRNYEYDDGEGIYGCKKR